MFVWVKFQRSRELKAASSERVWFGMLRLMLTTRGAVCGWKVMVRSSVLL